MTLQQELCTAKKLLEGRLSDVDSLPLLIEQYTTFMRKDMPGRSYCVFSEAMQRWLANLSDKFSTSTVNKIHQLELVTLMQGSLAEIEKADQETKLPSRIITSVHAWFEYLTKEILSETYVADIANDLFKKDLSISALNLWPSSSICHYERMTLPRRFIVADGMKQLLAGTRMLLWTLKNNRCLYETHNEDRRTNPHFLEQGWRELYQEMAERLEGEPHIAGVFAASWFWDPRIAEISPKFAYLRALPESGGASFYFLREDNTSNHVALQNKKRKRLYDEGKYIPSSYVMIWPRSALLQWANSTQG